MKPGVYERVSGPRVRVPKDAKTCNCTDCPAHPHGPVITITEMLRDGTPCWVYQSSLGNYTPDKDGADGR